MRKVPIKKFIFAVIFLIALWLILSSFLQKKLLEYYQTNQSTVILDRFGKIITILPNQKGYYAYYVNTLPHHFKQLLVKKEDRFFYFHPGINPISIAEDLLSRIGLGKRPASSTITQQLVKTLLGNELQRGVVARMKEIVYALALETWHSKEDILTMYANSIYFGNQMQGIHQASQFYFNLPPESLPEAQILQLLASISSPSKSNPLKDSNVKIARSIAKRLHLNVKNLYFLPPCQIKKYVKNYSPKDISYFELTNFIKNIPEKIIQTHIDLSLSQKIREIVWQNIQELRVKNAKNAAVVVIKLPENELLAIIGSPNPSSFEEGYKINMALQPRPVGSTIKPFIYLKAFEKGLRPYTLVEDREYKYITALGFPLYPKNFDYKYRGVVTLHYALSNSLNVPAVKVLEYVGLEDFYQFLTKDLNFTPIQDLNNYQLGIALGALEMDLYNLCKYFTIFANNGSLREIQIFKNSKDTLAKQITKPQYIQLINKILSDRKTGVEQFGLKSELNLFQRNYAVKTGTSKDFKDSWIVGYTPDFLVGVWVGNADNSPTLGLSGQLGAGRIWHEVMELLLNSNYNKKTPFVFDLVEEFPEGEHTEYGLQGDDYKKVKNILLSQDSSLILTPHNGDRFLLEENTKIICRAKESVDWFINNQRFLHAKEAIFVLKETGVYKIMAKTENAQEIIEIIVAE